MVLMHVRRHRQLTVGEVNRHFSTATGTIISSQTAYGRLLRRAFTPGDLLNTSQKENCFPWSQEHYSWRLKDWDCALFTDESRFGTQSDSCRTII
ncbi:hypothetical protein AVEN_232213-1 [Araneus ventricosus]|uniref:Transposase Tc1-like domain-containing protein n=1 Tax=Araneus ventricosus TaxID=182803 RepID=A0A4Y2TT52_ARAVE|nr:hypothetical protein AVEN_232213-1 [Araneus ventricosus]